MPVVRAFNSRRQILAKDFKFNNVKRIGIYVLPSNEPHLDRLFANLQEFEFQSRGYEAVKINPLLNDSLIKLFSRSKSFDELSGSLRTLPMASDIDLIAVSSLAPDSYALNVNVGYRGTIFSYRFPFVKGQLSIVDQRSGELILGKRFCDSTEIAEVKAPFVIPESKRYVLERALVDCLSDFPVNERETDINVRTTIPIVLYVDEAYREYFHDWASRLQRRFVFVNDIFMREARIYFRIKELREWKGWFNGDVDAAMRALEKDAESGPWLNVGVTLNREIHRDWTDPEAVGERSIRSPYAVVAGLQSHPRLGSWNSLDEAYVLTHELAHVLGVPHFHDPQSIMYPTVGQMNPEFDSVSQRLLRSFSVDFLGLSQKERVIRNLVVLNAWSHSDNATDVELVPFVFSDIDYLWRDSNHVAMSDTSIKMDTSQANILLAQYVKDPWLIAAVRGFLEMRYGRWKNASEFLQQAVGLKPDFVEAYQYMMAVDDKLGDKSRIESDLKKIQSLKPDWF